MIATMVISRLGSILGGIVLLIPEGVDFAEEEDLGAVLRGVVVVAIVAVLPLEAGVGDSITLPDKRRNWSPKN